MACYVLELFFNIIFLLFIWEFILYTHSHLFPIPSLVHPPKLVLPHQSLWNTKSYLHCPYTYCSMVKLSLTSPLMKTEVSSSHLPTPLPSHPRHQKPSTVKTYTAASLSQFLRSLFQSFWAGLLGVGEFVTESFNVSLSYESAVTNTTGRKGSLPIAASDSMDHGLPHSFWRQHGSQKFFEKTV